MNGTNVYKCHVVAMRQRNQGTKFSVTSTRDIEKHRLYNFSTLSWALAFFFCLLFQSQTIQDILEFSWQTRCSNQGFPTDVLQQNPAVLCQQQQYTGNVSQNAKVKETNIIQNHSREFLDSAHIVHTLAAVCATNQTSLCCKPQATTLLRLTYIYIFMYIYNIFVYIFIYYIIYIIYIYIGIVLLRALWFLVHSTAVEPERY